MRRIARAISGFVLLICANSAISVAADPADDPKTVLIKLERGVCFGTCPAYSIELSGDGTVDYKGEQFVLVKGHHTRAIAPAVVVSLLDKFRAADFWSLRPRYIASVTDNPEYRVTLTIGGRTKSVIDYVGRDAGMPESVTELEAEIDGAAGSERWTQGDSETFPSLRDEHFDFHSDEAAEMLSVSIEHANRELTHGLMDAGAMDSQPAKDAALMSAAASGDLRLVTYILRRGANPNGQDSRGRTAIMRVEYRPHSLLHLDEDRETALEMILMLVATGADPNVPDKAGNTALHLVDTKRLVPALIKAGAQLERRNVTNETPLLTASSEDVALALIAAGADIDARDNKGRGLLEKARARYWSQVVAKIEAKQTGH